MTLWRSNAMNNKPRRYSTPAIARPAEEVFDAVGNTSAWKRRYSVSAISECEELRTTGTASGSSSEEPVTPVTSGELPFKTRSAIPRRMNYDITMPFKRPPTPIGERMLKGDFSPY
ncbi:hypothetical protein CANCADRAFT_139811 [Tortispora caseinolytica NRRL Y-17796]|uniref:Uncharacterized protein n=1 Tax=Tortispora caseinolytica NRRL Y-17796 TaxID=767744 RepID=A0A1E4TCH0_9ASCO|nr:hypothetical protein CANCADRAFT_139811 [Tortispora caseinolytica NRRL Y-17796]